MPAHKIDPVGQGIQPRQRHVARAQHQRPEIIAEARQHRPGIEKDHGHAVHGEKLVILLRRQQMQVRPGQLQPEDQRLDPARDQKDEGGDDIADADLLVIHRGQPAVTDPARFPTRLRSRSASAGVSAATDGAALILRAGHVSVRS